MRLLPHGIKARAIGAVYRWQTDGILMWHHGRCGSTVLAGLLNQHPAIRWHGEIYHRYENRPGPVTWRDDIRYVQFISGRRLPGLEIKGLPCQHPSTIGTSLREFAEQIRAYGFRKCIFLDRRNILRKLLSVQIVDQGLRSSYHEPAGSEAVLEGRLKLDIDRVRIQGKYASLLDMIEYIVEETNNAHQVLTGYFDVLPVVYECHIERDPLIGFQRICSYFGFSHCDARITKKRINTKSIAEVVSNLGQVEELLAGTRHEWMLAA